LRQIYFLSTIIGSLALSATMPGRTWAADAAAPAADAPVATAGAGTSVEAVIVTAQRRREDVRKVPASISVLSPAALAHINGLEDISRAVPGLSFASGGGPGLDHIEMRGVSSTSGSATVGLYLDDVPITVKNIFNGAVEPRLFDLDRVEVLRGPQGTLYGASSMGGAIRFISNQPNLDKYSATLASEVSGTDHGGANYDAQGVLNVPLLQGRAAVRLGVDTGTDSGYIDNYTPGGELVKKGVNDIRWTVVRGAAKLQIDPTLSATLSIVYELDKTGDTSVFYPQLGLYEQEKIVKEPSRNQLSIGSLSVVKDFGWVQATSITSYFSQEFDRTEDGTYYNSEYLGSLIDADPPNGIMNQGYNIGNLPGPEITRTKTDVFTQELRFSSKANDGALRKLSWIAGLFYTDYTVHRSDNAYVLGLDATFQKIYGIPPQDSDVFAGSTFPGDSVALAGVLVDEKQYAAYADVTYQLLPNLKASAGLRYNDAPATYTQLQTGYFAGNAPPVLTQTAHFSSVTPKFSVSYDATAEVTGYVSVAQGSRLGGSEGFVPTDVCGADLASIGLKSAPQSFSSDSLWSYEGGVKGRFLGNSLAVNADFYYAQWSNIQQTVALPTCGFAITTNVGSAESYGPELDLNYKPVSGLTLGVSAAWTHAALTSVTSSVGASVGQSILNVPKWMADFRFEYIRDVVPGVPAFLRADYDWTGESYGAFSVTDPDYSRPAYSVLNASLGLRREGYEASLFVKNLLSDSKIIQHPSLLFLPEAYTLRPLTAGIRLTARF
jgi:outer membrane receptor protein involved in Fe transport